MRIWLWGEFSGYHQAIMDGLCKRHENVSITLVSSGDGWKKIIPNERSNATFFSLNKSCSGIKGVMMKFRSLWRLYRSLPAQIDVAQLVNPIFVTESILINFLFLCKLRKISKKIILIVAGTDARVWEFNQTLNYSYVSEQIKKERHRDLPWMRWPRKIYNQMVIKVADVIIPTMYEYLVPYQGFYNTKSIIPLPCPLSVFDSIPLVKEQLKLQIHTDHSLTFFHGVSRPSFKGTEYIREAFIEADKLWGEKAKFIIADRMPYAEYVNCLSNADIIVDQCLSYSYGMNAIIALASGKICLSGAEEISLSALGISASPIYNIIPSKDQILSVIDEILSLNSDDLLSIRLHGLDYVSTLHDPYYISECFYEIYKSH